MNEFEWLKQTRSLKQPVEPAHDLWSGIAARIGAAPHKPASRSSRLLPWAMAASLAAVSVLAGVLVRQQHLTPTPRLAMQAAPARTTPWKPRNPLLAGPAIELNLARQQLTRAIRQSPHDPFLRHMLAYTNAQVERLQQLPHSAG